MTDDINENGGGVPADPASGTGAFFTKDEILDFVTANPPMGDIPPADEPLDPNAPKLVRGEDRYMSRPEAIYILGKLATSRRINVDGVTALQMGARALMKRHADRERNWAKRREASQASKEGDAK